MTIIKQPDGKFILPKGWVWRKAGERIRRGDLITDLYMSRWEYTNEDWWGKEIEPLDLVIRRIR